MSNINFIMPGVGRHPSGGYKIVYEYANRLVKRGHAVNIIHAAEPRRNTPIVRRCMRLVYYLTNRMNGHYRPDNWFALDSRVRTLWLPSLCEKGIPPADVTIATAWQTAPWVASYGPDRGKPLYLIQGLETWSDADAVVDTWKLPLQKVVISRWLEQVAESMGERAEYIPNGLDFDAFGLDIPMCDRTPHRAMMLYSRAESKGAADGLRALELVKAAVPELEAVLFGVRPPQEPLPGWIDFHHDPPQDMLRRLYNESSVFIAPSWSEGWGLTAAEALMCGCALAATENGGHKEFSIHEETALLSQPKDPAALAENILRLIRDSELRTGVALRGHEYVQQFTWDRAVESLDRLVAQQDCVGEINNAIKQQ